MIGKMSINICFRYLGTDHIKGTCITSIVGKHYNADRHTRLYRDGIAPIDAAIVEYSKGENSSIRWEDPIIILREIVLRKRRLYHEETFVS